MYSENIQAKKCIHIYTDVYDNTHIYMDTWILILKPIYVFICIYFIYVCIYLEKRLFD